MSPTLPDVLAVKPFAGPVRGSVRVPGSKSLTNRGMLLSALCDRPVTLTGALFSEDTQVMAEALRRLGFTVEEREESHSIRIEGRGGDIPTVTTELNVGLAGTAARFLTAFCASSRRGVFRFDGIPQMRKRPMKGLIDALRSLGADIRCTGEEGFLPFDMRSYGLRGGPVAIDARESSQMLSALLMVAPLAEKPVVATPVGGVRAPFVRMTIRQMAQFGVDVGPEAVPGGSVEVRPAKYRSPGGYAVEPDATTASYFAALPLVTGGSVMLEGLRPPAESLQGDVRFLDVLARCGAQVATGAAVTVSCAKGGARTGYSGDFSAFSDTFLTLAAISPLLIGPTRITGIAHTRRQETDRVSAMAAELKRLGQEVDEKEDALEIHPRPLKPGTTVATHGDHRFAMSFAVLGCHDLRGDGSPWLSIEDPACCAKTFPGFFAALENLRAASPQR